ncbi:MAG TPA: ATP synthase subunit I [Pseudomonas sp.]|nr:ATP synthase subunit I [Pseudomonas sp.]
MNDMSLLAAAWPLAAALLVGGLAGLLHFASLALNLRLFTAGRVAAGLALQLLRLALTAAVLAGLARFGVGAVLAGALGLLLARRWVLRRGRAAA